MAYLRTLKNREGRTYYYVEQSYRDRGKHKKRTLKLIGRHDRMLASGDPDPMDTAKKVVTEWNKNKSRVFLTKTVSTDDLVTSGLLNFGYQVLAKVYKLFGISKVLEEYAAGHKFSYNLDSVLKLLVIGRILDPSSKSKTIEKFQNTLATTSTNIWNISQNDMDRSLDHLPKVKNKIQLITHQNITKLTGRTGYLVFYDVTNYFFESDLGDPDMLSDGTKTLLNKTQMKERKISISDIAERGLRKRGVSKEYRHDRIVQLGLFMDSNGIPISYQIFPGNESDPLTYCPAINQVKQQFNLKRIITVADKALNSNDNVAETYSRGDGWLFSQKVRGTTGVPKEIQDFALDHADWEFSESKTFAKKSKLRTREIKIKDENNRTKTIPILEKVLITWNRDYAVREQMRRDSAVKYAAALTNPEKFRRAMRKGGKKYLRLTLTNLETGEVIAAYPQLDLDQKQIDFDAQFDGINVIVTSETKMSDEDMIAAYSELSKLEDCFKVTKSPLRTRPVFVWTKEHIEAHFLTCFIALTIIRFLEYKLDRRYSPERIIDALNSLVGTYWAEGHWEIFASDDAKSILGELGFDISKKYQPVEQILNLERKLTLWHPP